jgi:hypothetical protein
MRRVLEITILVLAVALTACGGKKSNPPPISNATDMAKMKEELTALINKRDQADKACNTALGTFLKNVRKKAEALKPPSPPPGTQYAIMPVTPTPTPTPPATPQNLKDCFGAAEQFVYAFWHTGNGGYPNQGAQPGQQSAMEWFHQQLAAMATGWNGGQTMNPSLAAMIGMPIFNQFTNSLQNPSLAGPLQNGVNQALNGEGLGLNNIVYLNTNGSTTTTPVTGTTTTTTPVVSAGTSTATQSGAAASQAVDLSGLVGGVQRSNLGAMTGNNGARGITSAPNGMRQYRDNEFRGFTPVF